MQNKHRATFWSMKTNVCSFFLFRKKLLYLPQEGRENVVTSCQNSKLHKHKIEKILGTNPRWKLKFSENTYIFCNIIMNLLPKSHQDFSQKEYWNTFFKKRGKKAFEWWVTYNILVYLFPFFSYYNHLVIGITIHIYWEPSWWSAF